MPDRAPSRFPGPHFSRRSSRLALMLVVYASPAELRAGEAVDIKAYFVAAEAERGSGLARKTKAVDVRPAVPSEVIVTMLKGEGKETQSPPASAGDMVVRNRCAETGNEEILVAADTFARRYEGPVGPAAQDGWLPYRPRGNAMRFVVVTDKDGVFSFLAPWGEMMIARPGDVIVQDQTNAEDTYRVAQAAFACTYDVQQAPRR